LGFADKDWRDHNDLRLNTGHLFKLNVSTISWASRKQQIITASSTEAKYVSLAEEYRSYMD
jgi:hypothetical protein